MSICSRSCRSIHVYLLPELPRYLCLSTSGASPQSMSIYIRNFLSIHAYLIPELSLYHVHLLPELSLSPYVYLLTDIPIHLCLSTPRALSPLSMSIYTRSFPSIYVYLHPELPLYPCLSTPGAAYLSMPIYFRSFLSIYVHLLPELSLYSRRSRSIYVYLLLEPLRSPFIFFPRACSLSMLLYSAPSITMLPSPPHVSSTPH